MEKDNTNTPQPELITSVPGFENRPEPVAVEAPEQIELPKDIFPEARQQELGGIALGSPEVTNNTQPVPLENGRFSNGIVPVEAPGPTAFNQAKANGSLPDHITIRQ
jgi:hypothetical protein